LLSRSSPQLFASAPKRLVTHIYERRLGAKSAQDLHRLPRSRSHLLGQIICATRRRSWNKRYAT
jgi:heme oxygenase